MRSISLLAVFALGACGEAPFAASEVRAVGDAASEQASLTPEASSEASDPDSHPVTHDDGGGVMSEAGDEGQVMADSGAVMDAGTPDTNIFDAQAACCASCDFNRTDCVEECQTNNHTGCPEADGGLEVCYSQFTQCAAQCGGVCQ